MSIKQISLVSALLGFVMLATTMDASATAINYIQTGHGAGALHGIAFDSDFIITSIGDTANVSSCGGSCLHNQNISASITINSLGTFAFVTPTNYFSNVGIVGFTRSDDSGDLFNGPQVSAWGMTTSIGPISGNATLLQWSTRSVLTSGGVLAFNEGSTPTNFIATVSAVPIPAAIWLFGSGLLGLTGFARKRKPT